LQSILLSSFFLGCFKGLKNHFQLPSWQIKGRVWTVDGVIWLASGLPGCIIMMTSRIGGTETVLTDTLEQLNGFMSSAA